MTSSFQVLFGDDAAPAGAEFYDHMVTVEVEENADLPGAFELTLPVATNRTSTGEDLTVVDDERFRPYARVAVVVGVQGARDACILDGYVLAHTIELDPGTTAAKARVWGQDSSCLMNLVEKTQARSGTDVGIANEIFADYDFRTGNTQTNKGTDQQPERHALMQRGTDGQFLRERARRTGRLFRVCCDDSPGDNRGYFSEPNLDGAAVMTLRLNPVASANVRSLKFSWDVIRPTEVMAQSLADAKEAVDGDAYESGLTLLDRRSLADFVGDKRAMKVRLSAPVDGAGELRSRSAALLREAGWFVKCEGEANLASLTQVPRVGKIVQIDGAGRLHSGPYLVWSVRHTISAEEHRIAFVLVRNAVGET